MPSLHDRVHACYVVDVVLIKYVYIMGSADSKG